MAKILYRISTQTVVAYPRNDQQTVEGLDEDYVVLNIVDTPPPEFDPQIEVATYTYVVDIDNLEYKKLWSIEQIPAPIPVPDWDAFNAYMLTDITFKSYREAVALIDQDLTAALFDGYGLIVTNGVSAFTLVWSAWCQASGITPEHKEAIALVAEQHSLPAEFVMIIRE